MPRAVTFDPDKLVDPVAMAEPNFAVKEVLQVSQGCYIMSTFASIRIYQLSSYELFLLLLNFKQILNFLFNYIELAIKCIQVFPASFCLCFKR